jgi:hypothetical protein
MVTKRTGRPRGRPKRNFFKDRDRYRLARINALMDIHSLKFEPAARLALATAEDKPVSPSARTKRTHRKWLEKGWELQSFERVKVIPERDSEIDTLRLKSKQYADDELAQHIFVR